MTKARIIKTATKQRKALPTKTERETIFPMRNMPHDLSEWESAYNEIVEPPYDPDQLALLLDQNTVHAACCRAKAADVSGSGYTISTVEGAQPDDPRIIEARQTLLRFLNFPCPHSKIAFQSFLYKLWLDYLSIGWGTYEVLRSGSGLVAGFEYVPARTVRVHRDRDKYVQIRGNKKVYFVPFGSKVVMTKDPPNDEWGQLDPNVYLEFANDLFINPETGEPDPTLDWSDAANELVFIPNPHPSCDDYGIPEGVTALGAMAAQGYEERYNLNFFERDCVPRLVIIKETQPREGGAFASMPIVTADDDVQSEGADVQNLIEQFFNEELSGETRSILYLESDAGERWRIEKLSPEGMDAHFMEYREKNTKEILLAHRMTPSQIGIVDEPHLGSTSGYSQAEQYKERVINPMQRTLSTVQNTMISEGLLIHGISLTLAEIDIRDYDIISKVHARYLDRAVLSVNEVREDLPGKEAIPGGDLHRMAFQNNPVVLELMSGVPEMAAAEDALKHAIVSTESEIPFDVSKYRE